MPSIKIGLIGGTGLGEALGAETGTRHAVDTPFGPPSDSIVETQWAGLPLFILSRHGPGHTLNPAAVNYRANVHALKQLGVTHVLASGAVGSLREEFRPRDLVVPDQIIDKTHKRPATFFDRAAVHVEFSEPFDPVLRRILVESATARVRAEPSAQDPAPSTNLFKVHDRGCYVCMEGPAFSTRAESLMHRLWGGDLIGMTAMPEARLAREAELPYALVALVTDYDCWRHKPPTGGAKVEPKADPHALLNEIIGNVRAATANAIALIRSAVERIAAHPDLVADCPASRALELAIWSDKSKVDRNEVDRLRVLWGKYFQSAPGSPDRQSPVVVESSGQPAAETTNGVATEGLAATEEEGGGDAGGDRGTARENSASAPESGT
jgi:5'-methylthioadenosine phosphorylase